MHFIQKIVSGGQTGVDRAALDVAKELKVPYGGWCPKGRWAEDGAISEYYLNMKETPSEKPEQRTEWNVRDSDGTLIIVKDEPMGGTLYTIEMAKKHGKPFYVLNLAKEKNVDKVIAWIKDQNVRVLNIAGPRASQTTGIYNSAQHIIQSLLTTNLLNQVDAKGDGSKPSIKSN